MQRRGFTLVELSIVLIIIGLIIGAVIKGKDLIRSAEEKKVYNNWIKAWQIAYNTYQDKTGYVLGDGTANGGTAATYDGWVDNIRLDTTTTVQTRLKQVGIDVPQSNIPGVNGGAYNVKGKYASNRVIVYLYRLYSQTERTTKNRLYIVSMPTDVAIAIDKIVDGQVDPSSGAFRRFPDNATGTDGTSKTWPDAQTTKFINCSLEL